MHDELRAGNGPGLKPAFDGLSDGCSCSVYSEFVQRSIESDSLIVRIACYQRVGSVGRISLNRIEISSSRSRVDQVA